MLHVMLLTLVRICVNFHICLSRKVTFEYILMISLITLILRGDRGWNFFFDRSNCLCYHVTMLMSWNCCVWGGFEPVFDQFLALALASDFSFSFGCLDEIFISFE